MLYVPFTAVVVYLCVIISFEFKEILILELQNVAENPCSPVTGDQMVQSVLVVASCHGTFHSQRVPVQTMEDHAALNSPSIF